MSDYHISEEDVDAVVRYLEIFHPEDANEEFARHMLEFAKSALHKIAVNNPDDIEELYKLVTEGR